MIHPQVRSFFFFMVCRKSSRPTYTLYRRTVTTFSFVLLSRYRLDLCVQGLGVSFCQVERIVASPVVGGVSLERGFPLVVCHIEHGSIADSMALRVRSASMASLEAADSAAASLL